MLGLMGFLVVPDMAASSIQVNRSSKEGDTGLSLTQLGSGFTVDPSFPLYMEGFLGFSRVDPRFLFSDGQTETRLPVRWNSVAASGGLGWDFPLTEHLVLRPIVNISLGHVESDVSLFARYLNLKYDVNLRFLKGGQLNNYWLWRRPGARLQPRPGTLRGRYRVALFADAAADLRQLGRGTGPVRAEDCRSLDPVPLPHPV